MAEARCHLSKPWQDQDFQEQHENQLGPWQWMKQGVPEKMFKIASGNLIAVVQASPAGQKACSLENVQILQRKCSNVVEKMFKSQRIRMISHLLCLGPLLVLPGRKLGGALTGGQQLTLEPANLTAAGRRHPLLA